MVLPPIKQATIHSLSKVTSATGASTRVEARGDILLAVPGGIAIADISITHPLAINNLAATTAGAAAARRTNRSAPRTQEWSRMAIPLCPSL
jgi:hypothetical protein